MPDIGDVVRIHYICTLQEGDGSGSSGPRGKRGGRSVSSCGSTGGGGGETGSDVVIESSRRDRRRPLEFVVGADQVVKGIDRSIRQMLFGERARIFVTALYAYGDRGLPPTIPPRAALVFDVNLMDFWPRPRWQKPLVQVLSEPYREKPYAPRPHPPLDGDGGGADDSSGGGSSGRDYPYGKVGRY